MKVNHGNCSGLNLTDTPSTVESKLCRLIHSDVVGALGSTQSLEDVKSGEFEHVTYQEYSGRS